MWGRKGGLENSFMIHRDKSEGSTLSMRKPPRCCSFKMLGDDLQKDLLMSKFSYPLPREYRKVSEAPGFVS